MTGRSLEVISDHLSFKDSRPNSWYNFSFDEILIALGIAKAVLYLSDLIL